MPNENNTSRIIRIKTVCDKTGVSRATVWAKLNSKDKRHDPDFPRPFKLSEKSVGWLESEIDSWIEQRAATRI